MGKPVVTRVEWQDPAKRQIQEIFDYYTSVAGVGTARKITRKIVERTRILARNPMAGEREWLLEDQPHEYRRLVEKDYKIVYRIDGDTVFVVVVWDCRRDPDNLRESVIK
jgi:plasmid stabilization system protein ParE